MCNDTVAVGLLYALHKKERGEFGTIFFLKKERKEMPF